MWTYKILTAFLVVIIYPVSSTNLLGKCCDSGEILKENENSTFFCVKDKIQRNSVLVPVKNLIKNNLEGSCLEYSTNFFEFKFADQKIIEKKIVKEDFYSKCCPVGHIYNPTNHSCNQKDNFEHTFINKTLVKIGLPQCHLIVDILFSNLDNLPDIKDDYCIDETPDGYVRRRCTDNTDVCNDIRCVKKCCSDGKSFVNGPYCVDTYKEGLNLDFSKNIENPKEPFAIIFNNTGCPGRFYLFAERKYQFNLLKNGEFHYWNNGSQSYVKELPTNENHGYCIEYSNRTSAKGFFFFHCLTFPDKTVKFGTTKYPKILSCVFLALTILIYLILGQTKKLFGKILINYCVSTFLMYALLIYAQFGVEPNDPPCRLVGFGLIFVSTVSFAWLNVMCCDIWLTFGSTKHSMGAYQRKRDLKKLFGYMAYGWGMPLLLSLLIYILSITESLSKVVRPYVGTYECFIERKIGNHAQLIFLRIPHLLIQTINAILFIKTIIYCLKIKNEIQRINDNHNEKKLNFNRDKEKLFLVFKLAVIMGITFIFDTATAFVDFNSFGSFWRNFEIVVDCINCLQGVYIFIIFICKKSIFNDFLKKLHIKKKDADLNNTMDSFTSNTQINLAPLRSGSKFR